MIEVQEEDKLSYWHEKKKRTEEEEFETISSHLINFSQVKFKLKRWYIHGDWSNPSFRFIWPSIVKPIVLSFWNASCKFDFKRVPEFNLNPSVSFEDDEKLVPESEVNDASFFFFFDRVIVLPIASVRSKSASSSLSNLKFCFLTCSSDISRIWYGLLSLDLLEQVSFSPCFFTGKFFASVISDFWTLYNLWSSWTYQEKENN